jgi:uncharacterized protein YyaL (SSP411 family)
MPNDPAALANAASPFLRHGAEQPVAWLPWGEAAFERARDRDRPILLDIGAVWCHWCHVMDRESYEDPDTAALINELFVPVKVDRDEMPDVDARYQRAVQSLAGQGGWPLTAFLTPDGEVFHGGTYFPPRDAHGRPSFRRVLREVARVWDEERDRARSVAEAVADRLATVLTGEAAPGELGDEMIGQAVDALAAVFDARHGGFGRSPKFPNVGGLGLLLDRWLDGGSTATRDMLLSTLLAMVRGGIHDQLGGGFHRYSTDARWIIPHFEKMAYDNGPLMEVLARAGQALDDFRLTAAATGVAGYYRDVAGELTDVGGFPASQDADIDLDDDGDYWTWTEAEVRAAVSDADAAGAALHRWGVGDPAGAMHLTPERHVLFESASVADVAGRLDRPEDEVRAMLETARAQLKRARDGRPEPYVDRTLYTGWVALVASGHLAAARHAGDEQAADAALRALERVWDQAWTEGRGVAHRVGDTGGVEQLGDQAYVAQAALDAFEWSQEPQWLERARAVVEVVGDRFAHGSGGLADRPADAGAAVDVLREGRLEITDSPEPSPTAVVAMTLARIGALDHDDELGHAGRALLRVYAGSAPHFAPNAGTYFRALRWVVRPVTTVVVVSEAGTGGDPLLRAALRPYRPATVVRRFVPGSIDPDRLPDALAAMLTAEAPRAYVCAGQTCSAPVSEPADLDDLLRTFPA